MPVVRWWTLDDDNDLTPEELVPVEVGGATAETTAEDGGPL